MKSRLLRLLPLLLLLAGCERRQSAVQSGDRMQVLHRGIGYEVTGLDPQLATGISEGAIETALFEGLVAEDPKDLHPVPGVAESWDVAGDGLAYTFHLRADARWSNGKPVTAGDFAASWQRILSPALAAPNAALLYVLQGAEAYHHGAIRDFSRVGVAALDARTLRVILDHAAPDFLERLTHWAWLPVYLPAIEAQGGAEDRGNAWARPGRLVGNGAFLLQSWTPDREIVLARSPNYWDARRVALREIHLYPIDSVEAEERAFRAGQLHVTDAIPIGRIEAYRRDAPQLLRVDPYLGTYYYALNVRHPSFGDPRVRRALSLAIDREAIAAKILHGVDQPATAFTPAGIEGYAP
ncbi:MAG TPA: peptide ABC transporter substrate-binding protein, partial [Opitutaceae bacterium]|nr:peptide ABC transporter substrate-binding protein [Opitutaceae bacterium]